MKALAASLLLTTACVHDSLERCGDLLCPSTAECVDNACVPRDAIAACEGMADGQSCTTALIDDGVCLASLCTKRVCGNGWVDPGEVCDGADCASDCGAIAVCPAIGETPRFSSHFEQVLLQRVFSYTVDETRQHAAAYVASGFVGVGFGPPEGPLELVDTLKRVPQNFFFQPHMDPEGDTIIATHIVGSSTTLAVSHFVDGAWGAATALMPVNQSWTLGSLSRGPLHRFTLTDNTNVYEYELDSNDQLRLLRTSSLAELGIVTFNEPLNISDDGLRAVINGQTPSGGVMTSLYCDRLSIDVPFSVAREIPDFTGGSALTLGHNCERIYFAAFGSVVTSRQVPP